MVISVYDSIDNMPVWNFEKINHTSDFSYLFKNRKMFKSVSKNRLIRNKLETIWAKLYDEFISEIGLSEEFKNYIEAQKQIVNHYYKAIVEGQRHELNFAKIKEIELEEKLNTLSNMQIDEMCIRVSKHIGYEINPHKISVKTFYKHLKVLSDGKDS